jgi:hypothetical protein
MARILDVAARIKAKRESERARSDAELFDLARFVPVKVIRLVCEAVEAENPALLEELPAPWKQKAMAAWPRIMGTLPATGKVLPLPLDRRCVRRRGG